jgi:hypothetical protein
MRLGYLHSGLCHRSRSVPTVPATPSNSLAETHRQSHSASAYPPVPGASKQHIARKHQLIAPSRCKCGGPLRRTMSAPDRVMSVPFDCQYSSTLRETRSRCRPCSTAGVEPDARCQTYLPSRSTHRAPSFCLRDGSVTVRPACAAEPETCIIAAIGCCRLGGVERARDSAMVAFRAATSSLNVGERRVCFRRPATALAVPYFFRFFLSSRWISCSSNRSSSRP